jgi:hypothetical protein
MSGTAERDDAIRAAMKVAAIKAGMIDLDWLKVVDVTKITLQDDGSVKGAAELVAALKAAKPHLFQKHMRDMTPAEQAEWWKEHARQFPGGAPRLGPMDLSKKAKDMSEPERRKFLDECKRRE